MLAAVVEALGESDERCPSIPLVLVDDRDAARDVNAERTTTPPGTNRHCLSLVGTLCAAHRRPLSAWNTCRSI